MSEPNFPYPTVLDQLLALGCEKSTARHDYTILELRNGTWYKWYLKNEKAGVDHLGTSDRTVPVRVEVLQDKVNA